MIGGSHIDRREEEVMSPTRIDWKGVFPATVTPFTQDGAFDESAFRRVIGRQIEEGAHGIIVAGSTGEWFSLTDEERIRLFEVAREQVQDGVLLAGTSAIGTDQAVALTKAAMRIGCDGALVLPPPYALPTAREVVGHFESIAAVGLPIMVYNNPTRTQVNLDATLMERIAGLDSIVALKDSSKNLFQKAETYHRVGDRLAVFTGMEPYGMTMIHRGAIGIVSMIANICCLDMVAYYEHAAAGRWAEGLKHQTVVDGVYEIISVFGAGNYPTVKACMNLLGRDGGYTRQPYLPLEESTLRQMKEALAKIEFLPGTRVKPV
jgi:4-hydroxy-tetrahydrodipicolinate synthase